MTMKLLSVVAFVACLAIVTLEYVNSQPVAIPPSRLEMDEEFYCSACEIISTRIEDILLDPELMEKTIKIGHRLKTGQMGAGKYVKYARSETRITEVFQEICQDKHFRKYHSTALVGGRKQFVNPEEDKFITNAQRDGGELEAIKKICYELVELQEDAMQVHLLDNFSDDLEIQDKMCGVDGTGWCDFDTPFSKRGKKKGKKKKKKRRGKKDKNEL